VGKDERGGPNYKRIKEKQIEIQSTILITGSSRFPDSAMTGLDTVEQPQQIQRRQRGPNKGGCIDKPVVTVHANRLTAVWRGERHWKYGRMALQLLPGGQKNLKRSSQIGSQADGGLMACSFETHALRPGIIGLRIHSIDR
jgi:hypothetical protein